jgi:hypothetical protein
MFPVMVGRMDSTAARAEGRGTARAPGLGVAWLLSGLLASESPAAPSFDPKPASRRMELSTIRLGTCYLAGY